MNRVSMYIFVVIANLAILHSSLRIVCAATKARAEDGVIGTVQAAFERPAETPEPGYSVWAWPVSEEKTIRRSFPADATHRAKTIEIDNFSGTILVVGSDSDQVQMVANQEIGARSKEDAQRALDEVNLEVTEPEDSIRFFVDGPFRHDGGEKGFRGFGGFFGDDPAYDVEMNFFLTVPRHVNLDVKTVNSASVSVQGMSGRYRIRNINGPIEVLDAGGSGEAHTINGDVRIAFRQNPAEDCAFGSVNGSVELGFAPQLSADFQLSSFSGSIYSELPLKGTSGPSDEQLNALALGPSFRHASGTVGAGGPEIRVETISGDIRVRKNHE